jgi:hypothetical protein
MESKNTIGRARCQNPGAEHLLFAAGMRWGGIRLHRLLGMLASAGLTGHTGEPLLLGSLATHTPPP